MRVVDRKREIYLEWPNAMMNIIPIILWLYIISVETNWPGS